MSDNIYFDKLIENMPESLKERSNHIKDLHSKMKYEYLDKHDLEIFRIPNEIAKKYDFILSELPEKNILKFKDSVTITANDFKKLKKQQHVLNNLNTTIDYSLSPSELFSDIEINFKNEGFTLYIFDNEIRIETNSQYHFCIINQDREEFRSFFHNAGNGTVEDYTLYEFISSNNTLSFNEINDFLKLTYDINPNSTLSKNFIKPLFQLNQLINDKNPTLSIAPRLWI